MFSLRREKNNKGFSLVELIIVIAIMAVLIGLLAPQYLKFVNRSKVVADMENAKSMADAINAVVMESGSSGIVIPSSGHAGDAIVGVPNLPQLPESKSDKDGVWGITIIPQEGVKKVTLNGVELYPDVDTSSDLYAQLTN